MRAAIWQGPGQMALGSVPDATCPADGVLLKVVACGICGTDVRSFYNGDRRIEPPWVLGHEISGEVIEIGPRRRREGLAASGISVGDAVHCISTLWCGHCRMCLGGNEHLCVLGELMGFDYQGAYAELVAIPQIALKNLFRIPDGLSPAHATFADPLSDVICGHKDIAIGLDDTVVGDRRRPGRRRRTRRSPGCRAPARCCSASAARTGSTSPRRSSATTGRLRRHRDRTACRPVRRATEDIGADVVIVACSSDIAQEQAMEMAAPRGRVLFFGGLPKGTTHMRFPSNILHYREVQVHGSYASRHRDQVRALDMLARDVGGIRSVVGVDRAARRGPRRLPRDPRGRASSRSSSHPRLHDDACPLASLRHSARRRAARRASSTAT